jgi:tetratricopeptide (TPR) repeat protein/transcriptional regulator with XRE-family HTH domain
MSFGAILRDHRRRAGLTQEALAERAGLSSQAIGALERGDRRFPHQDTITRLAGALGLSGQALAEFTVAARRRGQPRDAPPLLPRQLPPDLAHFTGRDRVVKSVIAMLERSDTVVVSAITGMGGIGKTALAVHVGHQVAAGFPDGQLYLDLHGTNAPRPAHEALGTLLRAFGVATEVNPADLGEATARLRSALAGRRVLLILDNATSSAQVAPLLPGTAGCAAIITSRNTLEALPQARHVKLDLLSADEARHLLAAIVGKERVDAEPDAAAEVVRRCGRLPLAVHLVGARLAARPGWPLAYMAGRLADQHRQLDELACDEVGVRASMAVSIDHLDEPVAYAFALLSLPELPDISLPVAAALLDTDERAAERVLERLADSHLLETCSPGRYRMHDLLRAYGRELAATTVPDPERDAAISRVLRLFVAVAWRSMAPVRGSARQAWTHPSWTAPAPDFAGPAEALAWLDEHRGHLTEIIETARAAPELVVRLSIGLFGYYLSRGYWLDWSKLGRVALAAAARGTDRFAQAMVRMDLGIALADLAHAWSSDNDEALLQLRRSLAEFRTLGDPRAVASCLINLADVLEARGDLTEAIRYSEECLAISRESGDLPGAEAATCGNLGSLYDRIGEPHKALAYYLTSLRTSEAIGYDSVSANALRGIGGVYRTFDRHDEALAALSRSAMLFEKLGDSVGQAASLHALGELHLDRRDYAAAVEALCEGLALAEGCEDRLRQAGIRHHLGTAMHALDRRGEARTHVLTALALYRQESVTEPPALLQLADQF